MNLFSITLVLFLIMDSVGNITSYLNLTKELDPKRRNWVLIREMLIALTAMLAFNFLGEYIFEALEVSDITIHLASGLILFLTAIKILFPAVDSPRANLPKGEPFVIPLAIPLIAGPSLLATIMLYAHMEQTQTIMLLAILIAWALSYVVLKAAPFLQRVIGSNGLVAAERLMGMVLVLIAIQRFAEGLQLFAAAQKS